MAQHKKQLRAGGGNPINFIPDSRPVSQESTPLPRLISASGPPIFGFLFFSPKETKPAIQKDFRSPSFQLPYSLCCFSKIRERGAMQVFTHSHFPHASHDSNGIRYKLFVSPSSALRLGVQNPCKNRSSLFLLR